MAWESLIYQPLSLFRFHLSPFPQKRQILRVVIRSSRYQNEPGQGEIVTKRADSGRWSEREKNNVAPYPFLLPTLEVGVILTEGFALTIQASFR